MPRLEVINEPTLPAIITDIKVGANSKITDCLVVKPIKFFGSNGFSRFKAVWIETTPPTKKEMKETIPKDPIIKTSISLKIRFLNTFHFVNFPKTF